MKKYHFIYIVFAAFIYLNAEGQNLSIAIEQHKNYYPEDNCTYITVEDLASAARVDDHFCIAVTSSNVIRTEHFLKNHPNTILLLDVAKEDDANDSDGLNMGWITVPPSARNLIIFNTSADIEIIHHGIPNNRRNLTKIHFHMPALKKILSEAFTNQVLFMESQFDLKEFLINAPELTEIGSMFLLKCEELKDFFINAPKLKKIGDLALAVTPIEHFQIDAPSLEEIGWKFLYNHNSKLKTFAMNAPQLKKIGDHFLGTLSRQEIFYFSGELNYPLSYIRLQTYNPVLKESFINTFRRLEKHDLVRQFERNYNPGVLNFVAMAP
ncbi:MAG: hypothetical protein Q8L85_00325 [Alphaproteobacteria bacterium]|nr:hypothetical protein [Alphaproteobacteria bacterium]